MTVSTAAAALIFWVLALSLFFNWYFSSKLARCKDRLETQHRINVKNTAHAMAQEAIFITGILQKAQLRDPLPPLNSTKWSRLIELYDDPAMMAYGVPAQITTDHDDRPAVYWKRTSVNEFESYELARLWLAEIL